MRFEEIKNSPCSQLKESTDSSPRWGRLSRDRVLKSAIFSRIIAIFPLSRPSFCPFFEEKCKKVAEKVAEDS